jgi:hypothetical protein
MTQGIIKTQHAVTNYYGDITEYQILFGVVPAKYKPVAQYFISRFAQLSAAHKSKRRKANAVPLADGDIEIAVYCYWELETQDLINYDSDLPREKCKSLLAYLWSRIPEIPNNQENKNCRDQIPKYALFDHKSKVTSACLMLIKLFFHHILEVCPPGDKLMWMFFMKMNNIHHYMCPHTFIEVKFLLTNFTQRLPEDNKITNRMIADMFRRWFPRPKAVTSKLNKAVNNMFHIICSSMAQHFIYKGMYNQEIGIPHFKGYVLSRRRTYRYGPNVPCLPDEIVQYGLKLVKYFVVSGVHDFGETTKRFKISKNLKDEFCQFLQYSFKSAIALVVACERATDADKLNMNFVKAITDYTFEVFDNVAIDWDDDDVSEDDVSEDDGYSNVVPFH